MGHGNNEEQFSLNKFIYLRLKKPLGGGGETHCLPLREWRWDICSLVMTINSNGNLWECLMLCGTF